MWNPDLIARIAEGKIEEAIQEGKFDNLPGKGAPIVFKDDGLPAHARIPQQILKNAGVLPEWAQIRLDILAARREVEGLRSRLARENRSRLVRLAHSPDAQAARARYAAWRAQSRALYIRRLKDVNTSILKYCLTAPSTAEPLAPYKLSEMTEEFDRQFPGAPEEPRAAASEHADHRCPACPSPSSRQLPGAGKVAQADERLQTGGGRAPGAARQAGLVQGDPESAHLHASLAPSTPASQISPEGRRAYPSTNTAAHASEEAGSRSVLRTLARAKYEKVTPKDGER